jgi:hypothetical protein
VDGLTSNAGAHSEPPGFLISTRTFRRFFEALPSWTCAPSRNSPRLQETRPRTLNCEGCGSCVGVSAHTVGYASQMNDDGMAVQFGQVMCPRP